MLSRAFALCGAIAAAVAVQARSWPDTIVSVSLLCVAFVVALGWGYVTAGAAAVIHEGTPLAELLPLLRRYSACTEVQLQGVSVIQRYTAPRGALGAARKHEVVAVSGGKLPAAMLDAAIAAADVLADADAKQRRQRRQRRWQRRRQQQRQQRQRQEGEQVGMREQEAAEAEAAAAEELLPAVVRVMCCDVQRLALAALVQVSVEPRCRAALVPLMGQVVRLLRRVACGGGGATAAAAAAVQAEACKLLGALAEHGTAAVEEGARCGALSAVGEAMVTCRYGNDDDDDDEGDDDDGSGSSSSGSGGGGGGVGSGEVTAEAEAAAAAVQQWGCWALAQLVHDHAAVKLEALRVGAFAPAAAALRGWPHDGRVQELGVVALSTVMAGHAQQPPAELLAGMLPALAEALPQLPEGSAVRLVGQAALMQGGRQQL